MKLYITYEVEGFDAEQIAGPYSEEEIQAQKDDIASFEGVFNVKIQECLEE